MKRLGIGLLVTVLLAGTIFGLLCLTGGEAWQSFLDEKLWPTVASVVSSIFGIYLMVSPVITRLSKSSGTMGSAAAEFAAALAALKNANSENAELRARLEAAEEAQRMLCKRDAQIAKLCRVFAIGFGADERMVKIGAAREMMKVVEEYEREEDT